MSGCLRTFLCLYLILAASGLGEPKLPLVAVLPMDGRGLTSDEASVITDLLGTELMRTESFRVMERSQMDNVLKEQGFQKSGACDNSQCAVEMGQLLGIDRMVVGSIGKVGRTFLVNVRMVNVGTGEVVRSVSRTTQGDIDELLMRVVPQVANELAEKPAEPSPMRPAVGVASAAAPSRTPETPAPHVKSSSSGRPTPTDRSSSTPPRTASTASRSWTEATSPRWRSDGECPERNLIRPGPPELGILVA